MKFGMVMAYLDGGHKGLWIFAFQNCLFYRALKFDYLSTIDILDSNVQN